MPTSGNFGKVTINGAEFPVVDWKVDLNRKPTISAIERSGANEWLKDVRFVKDFEVEFDSSNIPFALPKEFLVLIEDINRIMPSNGFAIVLASAFTSPPFGHLGIDCAEYLIMRDGEKVAVSPETSSDFKMAKSLPADHLCVVISAAGSLCMGRI